MKLRQLVITDIAQRDFEVKEIYKIIRGHRYSTSWGMNTPSLYKDQVLVFKVQGFEHKGWVYVSLDWDDTFTITLTKLNRTSIVKQIKWVYIDQLIDVLDVNIEKGWTDEEYKQKVNGVEFVI